MTLVGMNGSSNLKGNALKERCPHVLSGRLNRLKAVLSLLPPFDRYRTASAIGSAIVRPHPALPLSSQAYPTG